MRHIRFDRVPVPERLYHGTVVSFEILKSRFYETGQYVAGDVPHDRLFASGSREKAIVVGFLQAISREYNLRECFYRGHFIDIEVSSVEKFPTLKALTQLPVYLHIIQTSKEQGWGVTQKSLRLFGQEFETFRKIYSTEFSVEKVDLKKWLQTKQVSIKIIPNRIIR